MATRHAEIAGAGIAGLTLASALVQRGWSVRVHERNDELREIGAGIFLWENALRVLERIGAFPDIAENAHRVSLLEVWDDELSLVQRQAFTPGDPVRMYTARRQDVYAAILKRAEAGGVDVLTNSPVSGATPAGELLLENGQVLKADLVVGADGGRSTVREALGLTKRNERLSGGTVRLLIQRTQEERDDPSRQVVLEYWKRERRFLYVPVAADEIYLALGTVAADSRGRAVPVDKAAWIEAFPHMAFAIERIANQGRWDQFRDVRVRDWFRGRTALVGDAAHAQPPHLAQGAALSMCNALALAEAPDRPHPAMDPNVRIRRCEHPLARHEGAFGLHKAHQELEAHSEAAQPGRPS
jgi:2-polyprenyl-6-methoxyphenol hydroxylase-like FAD-dependent oxidoreductase